MIMRPLRVRNLTFRGNVMKNQAFSNKAQGQYSGAEVNYENGRYEFVSACLLALAFIFTMKFEAITLVAFFGLAIIFAVLQFRNVFLNIGFWFLLVFAAYGAVSAIWSTYPSVTLYYSIQAALTILAGSVIGSSRKPESSLLGVCVAFNIFILASLVFGRYASFEGAGFVFIGLAKGKNAFGEAVVFALLFSLSAIILGLQRKNRVAIAIGIGGVLLGLVAQWRAHSTGTLVAGCIAVFVIFVLGAAQSVPHRFRAWVVGYAGVVCTCAIAALILYYEPISAKFFEISGKDPTLTGRTHLWYVADQLISNNYWFGTGQYAFWVQGNPEAERIWTENFIKGRNGFNFHNSYREIMVAVGMTGLILYTIILSVLLGRQLHFYFDERDWIRISWLGVCGYFLCRVNFEAVVPSPMGTATFLMSIALSLPASSNDGSPHVLR